jgi:cholesterol transport system auxiliary component
MYKRNFLIFLLPLLLSSCTLFSPVKVPPTKLYVIDSCPQPPVVKSRRKQTIIVTKPETTATYNTTQMAYSLQPHQIAFFARNRWAETPADMLQPLIIQTLQKTLHFYAVSARSAVRRHHYILNTQILVLQQEFYSDRSYLHFVLRAQIVTSTGSVIASRQFSAVEPAPEPSPYGGVIAANRAVTRILNELALFCLQKMPSRK